MKKVNKAIPTFIKNAKKGNIAAKFELFQYVESTGSMDVENAPENIRDYYKECVESLQFDIDSNQHEIPVNKISLDKLRLIFFRKFKNIEIKFEKDITIFIGDNGAGKTTILDAISRIFSYINARIIVKGRNGRHLDDSDVCINCNDVAEVIAGFSFGNKTIYNGSLVRPAKGIETSKLSELEEYSNFSNLLRVVNARQVKAKLPQINIPFFAYYTVERSNIKLNKILDLEAITDVSEDSRFDALDKSVLDGTGNLNDFLQWFVIVDNLAKDISTDNYDDLIREISALKLVATEPSHPLWNMLTEKELQIKKLKDKKSRSNIAKNILLRNCVQKAIVDSIPSIKDIFVDRNSGRAEVKVVSNGIEVTLFQLSKGQQVFLSLIADIVRRLVWLNPTLNNPLCGQGIILIDEVELHLHPEWQQVIAMGLRKIFPNIQFIITTHSPQVLSSLPKEKIRVIGQNNVGEDVGISPLAESYARSNAEVLQSIMHVNPTPIFPEKKLLNEYRKIIEQGDFRSERAGELELKLNMILGESHTDLVRLAMVKRRREKLG